MDSRRWVKGPVLVGVAALVVALGGCGGGDDKAEPEVASAPDAGGSAAASGAPKQATDEMTEYVEGRRAWVRCLRAEGLDVPDPDAKGQVELGDAATWKRDPKSVAAQQKCASLVVTVPESVERAARPKLGKDEVEKKRNYSKCMQEKGAPDFPDTDDDGYFQELTWDQSSPAATRAARECGAIIGIPADAPAGKG